MVKPEELVEKEGQKQKQVFDARSLFFQKSSRASVVREWVLEVFAVGEGQDN
jgi:hypothetical protein